MLGDIGNLRALSSLQTLGIGEAQVHGDIGYLCALSSLQTLGIGATQAHGDIGNSSALTSQLTFDAGDTQVHGVFGSSRALASTQHHSERRHRLSCTVLVHTGSLLRGSARPPFPGLCGATSTIPSTSPSRRTTSVLLR